jgi:putative ABC transport system substrate-binding protein
MRRREFIGLAAGAAVWPRAARAQQPAMPVIGFLHSGSPRGYVERVAAFRQGLAQGGFIEGKNAAIEYRWAEGYLDRLPEMAADLVRRNVAVVVAAGGVETSPAAKAATSTIPIVFANGADPVAMGLVTNLAKPEGNITGVSFLTAALGPKRLGLLHELVPKAKLITLLLNPKNTTTASQAEELATAARTLGLRLETARVSSEREMATLEIGSDTDALIVSPDPFFTSRYGEIAELAIRRSLPAVYPSREFVEAGGVMSYGTDVRDQYRQVGMYVSRILKGTRPAELPIVQPTRFELIINLKAAKALALEIPATLLARADEVIE